MLKYFFIIVAAVIALASGAYYDYTKTISKSGKSTDASAQPFIISSGESFETIAKNLSSQGLISSKLYFKAYAWEKKWSDKFKAGEYMLSPEMSIMEIQQAIVSGTAISKDIKILIKEGMNTNDIADQMASSSLFSKNEFLNKAGYPRVDYRSAPGYPPINDYSQRFSFLKDKPAYYGLEGYLFPDTYKFYKDTTPEGVIMKLLANFDKKLTSKLREDISAKGKTIYEIITMASLIEKEVRSTEDMKLVSGIFWNRIKNGKRLESCATLAYLLGVNKPQYSVEDTWIDSPYNTYRNEGLPPGPICNPGIKAIEAAIYPENTDYLYFLTSSGGQTIFAKTFKEHIANKAEFLR